MLSAEQWARLDPGNARPWLHVLGEAVNKKDLAARNEALHQISAATRMEDGLFGVPSLIANSATGDDSLVAAISLAVFAIGMSDAARPPYKALIDTCQDAKGDVNLIQTCSRVGSFLAQSNSFVGRAMGVAIGRRVGWPVDVTDRLRAENLQLQLAQSAQYPQQSDVRTANCSAIRKGLETIRQTAAIGEVAAARAVLASSPTALEELVAQERQRRELRDEEENTRLGAGVSAAPAADAGSSPSR